MDSTDRELFRAPIICIVGHVDVGKTELLDNLKKSHTKEVGCITQKINIINIEDDPTCEIPGIVIIDTPGHESFHNLFKLGIHVSDIVILVLDIFGGLDPQSIILIDMLKKYKIPFIVVVNKIDRLYEWRKIVDFSWRKLSDFNNKEYKKINEIIDSQHEHVKQDFNMKLQNIILSLTMQGLNSELFYKNDNPKKYLSIVPISAKTGDGVPDLITLIKTLSSTIMKKQLYVSEDILGVVLDVNVEVGLGTTIDIILINGTLKVGYNIMLLGKYEPIITTIKHLLNHSNTSENKFKKYRYDKEISGCVGLKIFAKNIENVVCGSNILKIQDMNDIEGYKRKLKNFYIDKPTYIDLKEVGIFIHSLNSGTLETISNHLTLFNIACAGVKLGPILKSDIMKASRMLKHGEKYSLILVFGIPVDQEAYKFAKTKKVKIIQSDIIFKLFEELNNYQNMLIKKDKEIFYPKMVFPCKLKIISDSIFKTRNPIVVGVKIERGVLKLGTPLCIPSKNFLNIGICTSIQINQKDIKQAKEGDTVSIKIESSERDGLKMIGRHFFCTDSIVSKIDHNTLDIAKKYFADEINEEYWTFMDELKVMFGII
uniref:Tr-type G domain-containing protein n=1 Tax=viral metagenome TaxID=1070528 RepID=A0A6C0J8S7_9ZZZZ